MKDASNSSEDGDDFYRALEIDTLARTMWGEARGEGSAGMQAVAFVVLNRLEVSKKKGGFWWGNSIIDICHKPYQFSCWNKNDPNYRQLLAVDQNNRYFDLSRRLAKQMLTDRMERDPTAGATHYHAAGITPYWVRRERPVAVIGRHVFYRIV